MKLTYIASLQDCLTFISQRIIALTEPLKARQPGEEGLVPHTPSADAE